MGRKAKTLKEMNREEPVVPPTWAGKDVEVKNEDTTETQAPAAPAASDPAKEIGDMIANAFNASRVKVAQDMLNVIMADPNFGPAEIALALQNEKLKPFLSQLTRCWNSGEVAVEHEEEEVAPRRRAPRAAKAATRRSKKVSKMSKGPRKTRVRLSDEERVKYNKTVFDLIKKSGSSGIFKQDLMSEIGSHEKRWSGRGQFLAAALEELGDKIAYGKEGVKVYYTVA